MHTAQDCMAGTIDNTLIAIIKPEEDVPMVWRVMAERTYPASAVHGKQKQDGQDVLKA